MADIKQAAKWIGKGKSVRRELWYRGASVRGMRVTGNLPEWAPILFFHDGRKQPSEAFLNASDLLADDWQLAD